MKYVFLITSLFLSVLAFAQDNQELQQMADADQQQRMGQNIDWKELNKQDSLRRIKAHAIIDAGNVKTAKDHYNVGIIFQHGNDTIASRIAVESFKKAIEMDSTLNRWWYAAAVDRDLMRKGEPQIYGTQTINDSSTNGKWKRYTLNPDAVTDEERRYYGVETLAEQEEKERLMNLTPIIQYYMDSKSVEKTIAVIKSEFKKGKQSTYNVSEQMINGLGYMLLNQNMDKDALDIFQLNTELYPEAFNTYDSYGETLLKLGEKEEAINAYKKSLELNPQNDNAANVLKKISRK
ncbi:tetratricopeptide repeat protein [Sphingobacterium gobiense]|uniref:Tetratricopeptide repeat protein n=1 Tax=Sphingobacterium gobiense TaxID=1382456 RepID=A0A2S9JUL9_9SPHI|nr:tetratricopeptide repeat protein [Sphingobacterium gobiense]PRD56821.1 tetratricopeptide repeat protein [Sphingobacterium gobiense]